STLVRRQAAGRTVLHCMRHPRDPQPDSAVLLRALGRLWLAGAEIDWNAFSAHEQRRRIPLPTYPFERQRHFLKARREVAQQAESAESDLSRWFHLPVWQQSAWPEPAPRPKQSSLWLIFADQSGVAQHLARQLQERGEQVVTVEWGQSFERLSKRRFRLDPGRAEDYRGLMEAVREEGTELRRIVHAWNVTDEAPRPLAESRLRSFDSLLWLAQALEGAGYGQSIQLDVLSSNLHRVAGEKQLHPEKALLQGPVTVLPLEYPHLACRNIDLPTPAKEEASLDALAGDVLNELLSSASETPVAYRDGQRWVRTFAPIPLQPPAGRPQRLRTRGVYLITGGLGGIGLTLAQHLASTVQARLVLTGRTALPEPSAWQEWLENHPPQEEASLRIGSLQALQEAGAEVLALAADVTDEEAMQGVLRQAEERFGALQGVIHAAGLPGGGMAGLKKPEDARKVLAPKVEGTLLLHRLLEGHSLDFFLICSSITALAGGFGQIDYTAANAFCDAFAHSQARRQGTWVASINWDRWEEVGMAARNTGPLGLPIAAAAGAAIHPLLETRLVETPQRTVFSTRFQPSRHWVLSEHRIAGRPTIPGATYLEMARAAWVAVRPQASPSSLSIREAVFLTPLSTPEDGQCEVLTVLDRKDSGFEFRVVSRGGPDGWQEHARGRIEALPESAQRPAPRNLDQLHKACSKRSITARDSGSNGSEDFLVTGPRWQSLKRIEVGEQEALAVLKLDETLASDLESYLIHPALLDVAAGSVQFLCQGDFLPLAYENLRLYAPFPPQGFSHIRWRGSLEGRDVITCDVSVLDSQGSVCAEIEGFSMKKVGQDALAQLRQSGGQASSPQAQEDASAEQGMPGIRPQQGAEAFHRILSRPGLPQVVVSPRPPSAAIEEARSWNRTRIVEQLNRLAPSRPTQARPDVSSSYAAPSSGIEERITAIWQKVLGLERVGANDNFFELGGTSLSGVQLVSELKQELGLEIPTVSIFEAPTVAALARYLKPDKNQESVLQRGRKRAAKKKQAIQRRRRARKR
ncbi:MAG: SDR family NAD(P)-dependent oxidoreductase, partial [Acidobacteriota bacterium]